MKTFKKLSSARKANENGAIIRIYCNGESLHIPMEYTLHGERFLCIDYIEENGNITGTVTASHLSKTNHNHCEDKQKKAESTEMLLCLAAVVRDMEKVLKIEVFPYVITPKTHVGLLQACIGESFNSGFSHITQQQVDQFNETTKDYLKTVKILDNENQLLPCD